MLSEEGTAAGDSWDPGDLAEELAMLTLVRLGQLLQNLPAELAEPEECQRVLAVARELTQLRRANAAVHRAQVAGERAALERERWQEQEFEKLEAKVKAEQERTERLRQQVEFHKRRNAERGRTAAAQDAVDPKRSGAEPEGEPTEAIRPNPTGSNQKNSGKAAGERGEEEEATANDADGRPEGGEEMANLRETVTAAGEPGSGGVSPPSQMCRENEELGQSKHPRSLDGVQHNQESARLRAPVRPSLDSWDSHRNSASPPLKSSS